MKEHNQHPVGHSNNKHQATLTNNSHERRLLFNKQVWQSPTLLMFLKIMIQVVIKHLYLNRKYFRQKLSYQLFSILTTSYHHKYHFMKNLCTESFEMSYCFFSYSARSICFFSFEKLALDLVPP